MSDKKSYFAIFGIFAALLIYIAILYINYDNNKKALKSLAQDNQINLVKLYEQRLDEWIESKKKVVSLASDLLIKFNQTSKQEVREILQNIANIGEFDSVYVGYADDGYIINTNFPFPQSYKPTKRVWYKTALETGSASITLPYEDAFIPQNFRFSVAAPFKTPYAQQAVVAADMVFDKIRNEILNINESLQGFAFLITQDGEIVASAEINSLNSCIPCEPAIKAIKAAPSKTSAVKFDGAEENLRYYEADGKSFILFYEPLKNADWIFAMSLDESKIFAPLNKNLKQNIALALIFALFGAAGVLFSGILMRKARTNEQIMLSHSKIAAMGEMLVAATHQLRQPVSAMLITLGAAKIRLGEMSKGELEEKLDGLTKTVKFMQNSLSLFRNFYSPHNKKERVNLTDVVNDVLVIMRPITAINGVDISFKFDAKEDFAAVIYPNFLKQILINLISNSKDAVCEKNGEENGYIKITLCKKDGAFSLSVEDNGAGVARKFIPRLFREMQTTKGEKGTGNGLYICKILAQNRLGGEISLVNAADPTVFEVKFKGDENE